MANSNFDISEKDVFEGEFNEESVILRLVPVNENPNEEYQIQPSVSSTSEANLKIPRTNNKVYLPQMNGQFKCCPKSTLPLPTILHSINKMR